MSQQNLSQGTLDRIESSNFAQKSVGAIEKLFRGWVESGAHRRGLCAYGKVGAVHHVVFNCDLLARERMVVVPKVRELGLHWDVNVMRIKEGYDVWKEFAREVLEKKLGWSVDPVVGVGLGGVD